jgi:hypothetical protein
MIFSRCEDKALISAIFRCHFPKRSKLRFCYHSFNYSKMKLLFAFTALIVASVKAHCPNNCSGHGTCGVDDLVSIMTFQKRHLILRNALNRD